ncbi:hypothetical protein [Streptomyces sp. UNOB3_S3]|uniref:hypothetical protein n=1 Tax=Streptomyces sp. UNOB3_S3 TaxID=2871682 RepID=UPI001E30A1E5|nr:hypothetical protein [Streptomyces sp. UNOB3_S3]MCC3775958.1 hypothetical protein [Streptomyces sp. UNOB3_S3]
MAGALPGTRGSAAAEPARRAGPGSEEAPPQRSVVEYELPPAEETHEIVKIPGKPMALVSQMSNSHLVKLRLDPRTERVTGVKAFALGPKDAMLHGLAVSERHPGRIWATHEGGNRLLLVDPRADEPDAAPRVEREIAVPGGGRGPHYVNEYGDTLWVTLKGSDQVLALDHTRPERFRLFEAKPHPIFAARHPGSGDFYVSQDSASTILRIDPRSGRTTQTPVPAERGSTPVGLISGAGAVWLVLLGTEETGTGTFGRIDEDGGIAWYRLRETRGRSASLLHLAFEPQAAGRGREPVLWLLASSIVSDDARDQIIRVRFDASWNRIVEEEYAALPTQMCKAHRLLPLTNSVLATELTTFTVAQLTGARD